MFLFAAIHLRTVKSIEYKRAEKPNCISCNTEYFNAKSHYISYFVLEKRLILVNSLTE